MDVLPVVLLLASALHSEPLRIESARWQPWSQRPATAPRTFLAEDGVLVVSGNGNAIEHGGWQQTVEGVKPGDWYRFSALYKAQSVQDPVWQILPRLDWREATGKRAGQPEYVYQQRREGDWTRTWIDVQAPNKASAVALQLFLSHSPGGTVWWKDVRFEPAAAPKERKIRVSTVNLRPSKLPSREANVEAFVETADKNSPGAIDLFLFPEGMTVVGTAQTYVEVAEPVPGPTTARLGDLARKRNAYVAAGLYESEGAAVYNTAVLIDRQGKLVGKYRKVYLPREEYEAGLTPGSAFPVFDTDFGRLGMMICYDVFYSDPARALASQGAEVILLPIWGGDETLAKARAIENRIFLVTSGYNHPTYIMDPNGERLSVAQERGTVAIATLELNRRYSEEWLGDMRARRAKELRTDVKIPQPEFEK